MKKSIKLNIISLFVSSLIIVLSVGIFINNTYLESHIISREETRLKEISQNVKELFINKDIELIEELEYESKVSIIIVDNKLNTIVGRRHLESEIKKQILSSDIFPLYKRIDTNEPLLVYVQQISSGYIILINPLITIHNNLEITNDFHIITAILAIFIGFIFMMIFSILFTNPIIEISTIAESMSKLDFSKKIDYKRDDELGLLANSINLLSDNLEKNITQLKDEVEFQKVLSRNMSHELKTPIAVIKGYVEGVYYGIAETDEEKEHYYNIIINECDRMNNLISDMLDFSKISATKFTLKDLTLLNSIDIKNEIYNIFSPTIENLNINFIINCDDFNFHADHSTIIRVISNFISNSIKYGDNNDILLSLKKDEDMIYIINFNTGENIDDNKLNRIFDAFYTLDESHSRENNGHGLGLAIVKSIAELYSGVVFMQNKDNGVEVKFIFPNNF